MAGRTPEPEESRAPQNLRPPAPSILAAAAVMAVVAVLLLSNGRPIGAGDTRPTERVAASLVTEADFDLDEYPEVEPPFARMVGATRRSIYPVASAVLAAPVFLLSRFFFALDETGSALAGKIAAALLSAGAAAILFRVVARRRWESEAWWTAILFALGTSVWSTSQALWQHPAAVLALSWALLWIQRADDDPVWAGRAGLPLALMVAVRHADVALAAVVTGFVLFRYRDQLRTFALWAVGPAAFVLLYQWVAFGSPLRTGFSGLGRFTVPNGVGHAGLLVSPGRGLLVYTPLVLVAILGMMKAYRPRHWENDERWFIKVCACAASAHWLLMGCWSEWHGGECWGPRMMTDLLPLLVLFLPDGFEALPGPAALLAGLSVGAQAIGAFAYDYRWERLYQRPPEAHAEDVRGQELWRVLDSPLAFYLRRGVFTLALPAVREGRAIVRERPVVVGDTPGARMTFAGERPVATGSDPTFEDEHLLRGARVVDGKLQLRARWDGVFLRVREGSRPRKLELRVTGRGTGVLYVGERTFWTDPKWTTYTLNGTVRIRHPYLYAESGGGDIVVTTGKGGGEADLQSIALVPPGEPENAIRLGGGS